MLNSYFDGYQMKYRLTENFIQVKQLLYQAYVLNALMAVLFCLPAFGQSSQPRPNIIMIIGDDMRYDSFEPTGGPSWFDSPSINRIANEGANFTNYFCVYSLCIPARSSMMTGLYSHSNGATDNLSPYYSYLPTIASILDSAGYHTAMVGKYHAYSSPQPGWDYWMARAGLGEKYINPLFNINGVIDTIYGDVTQIINDTSYKVISEIDTPYFVCIGHHAPHQPAHPLPENEGIYAGEIMPVPANFSEYKSHYPSFLYEEESDLTEDKLILRLENYFESLKGVDDNLEDIFNALTDRNQLDNTLILFTGDNGYLYGEHGLEGKGFPYDPSIKLPMFIRYPAWFTTNTIVDKPMGLNIDIAPTLLEAAGIDSEPYHFQGVSLYKLATGELMRNKILYENIKLTDDSEESNRPSMRTIRSKYYKYNWYQCEEQTEEFFDLSTDPDENTNLIMDPDYADMIESYRYFFDSVRVLVHDTLTADTLKRPCYLTGKRPTGDAYPVENAIPLLQVVSNPFKDMMAVNITAATGTVEIRVFNQIGQLLLSNRIAAGDGLSSVVFDTADLPQGIYFIHALQGENSRCEMAIKE